MPPRLLAALALALALPLAACSGTDSSAQAAEGAQAAAPAAATDLPLVTIYKTPTCGCCAKWVEHVKAAGFPVRTVDLDDLSAVKAEHGVPRGLASCHTATVDGYTVEGHVPAEAIVRLLAERPEARGIAVPGMPMGSPGMEGPVSQPYEVYTFDETGPKAVFSAH